MAEAFEALLVEGKHAQEFLSAFFMSFEALAADCSDFPLLI